MQLSPQQLKAVNAPGDFILLACPGSGKTRAAAERIARLAREPRTKVAACSYTNVGADRLGAVLERDLGLVLGPSHFIGTIHRFLLRYVVTPFGHLMGAATGPTVVGGVWPEIRVYNDNKQRITLDAFRRDVDGNLRITSIPRGVSGTAEDIIASVGDQVISRKRSIFKRYGYVTADDAMWVALSILRARPDLAATVARRFDEIVLDEAQDTSELQLACLAKIHETNKLKSLVLIGDLEQSIYSFQGASARRCKDFATDRGLSALPFDENWRSSQRICNVAVHFCERDTADAAVGPHADCDIPPEVTLYPVTNPQTAMTVYRERLEHYDIREAHATVLARNWRMVDELNGHASIFDDGDRRYRLGRAAGHLAAGAFTANDLRHLQSLLSYCAWDQPRIELLADDDRERLRVASYDLAQQLPPLDGTLHAWITSARTAVEGVAKCLAEPLKHTGGRAFRAEALHKSHQAQEVFAVGDAGLRARTVHSFKGEDNEAVMVVIRRPHASDPTSQLELWEAAIGSRADDPEKAEERRVLFVALTRAQRYCLVALPDNARGRAVLKACAELGFEPVDSASS